MSLTAKVTAFARAYHSIYESPKIFCDSLARDFFSEEEFDTMSQQFAKGIKFSNPKEAHLYPTLEKALGYVVQTQLAPTTLSRSKYCEEKLENEVKLGTTQYVILGAGFDTFAFRKDELLKHLKVFELDHPKTQELKLTKLKSLGFDIPQKLEFIPIDFSKDSIYQKLKESSFDPKQKTFYSFLGVTYYLTRNDVLATLKEIAAISPAGSSIVFDYPDKDIFQAKELRVQNMLKLAMTSGEPMKNAYSYKDIEHDLKEAGFLIYDLLQPEDIENRYFKDRTDLYHAFEHTNFLLAVKQ